MEIDNRVHIKYKIDYLILALKISKIRYNGDGSPKKPLQCAYEEGRLAGVSEEEFKNF
jgi:hypothetical protein